MATLSQIVQNSHLKASVDGPNGAGKSALCCRLAIGISKELCNSAPVLVADSEERYRFYKHTMFDPEGTPLIRMPGDTLIGVQRAIEAVEKQGACVFIGDQLTTPWKEGLQSFSESDGFLSFEKRAQLMAQWLPIVQRFRYGKFHAICAGRIGFEWENLEDDRGRRRLTQGNSKFNAGGSENFGYEADLELEMSRRKRRVLTLLRGKTSMEYVCQVIKDAAAGLLNGQEFVFQGQQGLYKAGDYQAVFQSFRPYLDFMRQIAAPEPSAETTRQLLISGKTPWAAAQSEREKLLEEIENDLGFCFPGGAGQSKVADAFRKLTLEYLTGSHAWSRIKDEASVNGLSRCSHVIRVMRRRIESGEVPASQRELMTLIDLAIEERAALAKGVPAVERVRGIDLSEALAERKGPQPVVEMLDREKEEITGD
ncbi:MAG: hypothetical protein ACLPLR_06095 [Terriglobales bacterium]